MGAGQVGVDENSASGAFLQNAFLLKNRQKSGNPLLRLLKMGVWAGICLPQKDSPAGTSPWKACTTGPTTVGTLSGTPEGLSLPPPSRVLRGHSAWWCSCQPSAGPTLQDLGSSLSLPRGADLAGPPL